MSPERIRPGSAGNRTAPETPTTVGADEETLDPATPVSDGDGATDVPESVTAPTSPTPRVGGSRRARRARAVVTDDEVDAPASDETDDGSDVVLADDAAPVDAPSIDVPAGESFGVVGEASAAPAVVTAATTAAPVIPSIAVDLDAGTSSPPLVTTTPTPAKKHGFFRRLYFGETNLEFVGRRKLWFTISTVLIAIGALSLGFRGLNLDIEFVGGTSWTVQSPTLGVAPVKALLQTDGVQSSTITILGNASKNRSIQVEAKIPKGQTSSQTENQLTKVQDGLAKLAHVDASTVSIESVGPSWGGSVTTKAVQALVVFFILVALYISVFFEWRMALAAIIAVIHDILVVVGIYSLTGFDVTPDTVVAILTILGYSLYDTIVVFDRIRDNLKGVGSTGRLSISDIVNLSMNQTLARSINTSLVAVLPIFAVLILGAEILGATTLQYFGWALLIGLTSGAYSSIFIASPIVAVLKEREPRWQRIRERLAQRGSDRLVLSPAALAAGLFAEGGGGPPGRMRRAAPSADAPAPAPGQSATSRSANAARRGTTRSGQRRPSGGASRKGGRR